MKVRVIKVFRDKTTSPDVAKQVRREVGDVIECDESLALEREQNGFVEILDKKDDKKSKNDKKQEKDAKVDESKDETAKDENVDEKVDETPSNEDEKVDETKDEESKVEE